MQMKNENEIWDWLEKEINRQDYHSENLPFEATVKSQQLDFIDFLGYLKKLEKVGAISILGMGTEKERDADFELHDIPIADVRVNRKITAEDYKILWCGNLTLNLITGKATYRKNEANYAEDTQQHILLHHLMSNPNKRFSLESIARLLNFPWEKGRKNTPTKKRIYDLLRDIKKKLDIKEEDELIIASSGYRLRCP